ncbi:uncharacterized protein BDR25DRAFT_351093 [Lindgomyces ingoldianus]|uniref:Uncharacterized protein n=1 Tax=Lindgomyces ingoldianus TaxID=673940 RepID=A0ACB6R738_9PLEO|nr:uncharacterized protein BDR25DRAFT_351093 [Lindgomyces ingoldianus]KAF2474565.1 hypothetical protein BDR25DRAFT_351093 [Lindgomyces ingoldianus]
MSQLPANCQSKQDTKPSASGLGKEPAPSNTFREVSLQIAEVFAAQQPLKHPLLDPSNLILQHNRTWDVTDLIYEPYKWLPLPVAQMCSHELLGYNGIHWMIKALGHHQRIDPLPEKYLRIQRTQPTKPAKILHFAPDSKRGSCSSSMRNQHNSPSTLLGILVYTGISQDPKTAFCTINAKMLQSPLPAAHSLA